MNSKQFELLKILLEQGIKTVPKPRNWFTL